MSPRSASSLRHPQSLRPAGQGRARTRGGRPGRSRTGRSAPLLLALALALTLVAGAAPATSLPGEGVLGREPQLTPDELGDGSLDGLQYADPAEGIALIEPPRASNQGNAALEHPLPVPPGRGIQPELALTYDSGGGSGWVGIGWDLSVGEITVDTRWGVPRYSATKESETYLLDGDVLSPTAVRSTWQDRVAERQDFTRRIETDYELVIRHGDSPKNYWWEVRDKSGGIRWYGGYPDAGGPDVGVAATTYDSLKRDPSAILTDEQGNGYRWALSAQRDIGYNLVRYFYETVDGERVGSEQATLGKQLYLKRIRYTAAAEASGHAPDPAYEVRFLRDDDITPRPPARKDVDVSARGGFLEVTSDLLRRIEVWYGEPKADESERDFDVLSRRYDLDYVEGAFGKSLLHSVDQVGSDGVVYATNTFDYYDDVRDAQGGYEGFTATPAWDTGDDGLEQILLGPVETSVLGASETNSGDFHGYFGFNPGSTGSKSGSFGGAITIKGGATEGLAEMMDINGDLLPDKVFRKSRGGQVMYRLNTSGPDGSTTFAGGSARPVVDLDGLSTEWNIGVAGGPEAYFGVSVQFSVAADVTVGEEYFTDVNTDGLPDFVSSGKVYFNHLDANGNPTFTDDSALTSVPIDDGSATLPEIEAIREVEEQQRQRSPLQDTVRRWVAPFAGTVSIDAPVTLDPPPDDEPYAGDGVRVAIQRGGAELWTATLTSPGQTATPSGVAAVSVGRGQAVYFRVGAIDDGARDQVRWDPRITYTAYSGTTDAPVLDADGLSQRIFDASDDFTLAGRPDTKVLMPLAGTVRFDATLRKSRATTDNLTVQVLRNGVPVIQRPISAATVSSTGIDVSGQFTVAAPTDTNGDGVVESADEVIVRIAVDSPIDVTALDWAPRLYYLSATSGGEPVQVSDDQDNPYLVDEPSDTPLIEPVLPADIDIYPQNTLTAPRTPWSSDLGRTVTVQASVGTLGQTPQGDVVLTVKQRNELVAKRRFTVPAGAIGSSASGSVDVALESGEDYWFDLSIRSPELSERVVSSSVELRWREDDEDKARTVPHVRNAAGRQSVFPLAYRGWGYAGYRADGDRATERIDEAAFVFRQSDFPQREPTGFDDSTYKDPMDGDAYAFTPYVLDLLDANGDVVGTEPVWRGFKDNLAGAAGFARTSRSGADNPAISLPAGAGVRAVRQVGVSAPVFALVAGIGPLSGSFGVGPSFGLLDYSDLNGDGFPDIVAPGYVKYTGPRGGYLDEGDGVTIVGQDLTFAVGGGFNGSAVEIKGNSKGDANTAQSTALVSGSARQSTTGGSARQGESASGDQYGVTLGGSFGINANFTNPNAPDPAWQDALADIPAGPGALEEELADVNGDGLPDKVAVDANGVRVRFNLGDGFASSPIRWASGGFETGESYSGSVGASLGFSINNKEFSGGLAYNESIDFPRYSWVDVDGDGVLDRLRKAGSGIRVSFGTNSGVLGEVGYGELVEGSFDLIGDIPTGQQVAQGRSRGLGGGFDFTIGIGPLCIPTPNCYIIINPGAHFDHSVSTNQVQLADVNGDGYPDSLKSTSDDRLQVRLNNRGRTNLLRAVTNPLGGEIRLGYARDGNTVEQPYSQWVLSSVEVDDNRAGDGPDTLLSTYEYSGNAFNALEREFLGYDTVVERQRAFAGDGTPGDDPLLRSIEREYRNATVFDNGLQTRETLLAPDGKPIKETRTAWRLVDLATGVTADLAPTPGDPAGVRLLQMAVGAVETRVEQRWFGDDGSVAQETWNTFEYDELGNVVRQVDVGEPELPGDDVVAEITYSNCAISFDPSNYASPPACPAAAPAGPASPLWDPLRCPTWTSLPAQITLRDGSGNVLRRRNGAPALCDNASVTDLREFLSGTEFAQTLLDYDDWGSYAHIEYPENADGERLVVDYVYDDVNHGNVGEVTDSHGLTATATFDGRTGRIASRTDANGQTTTYTYDAFGRLASITGPYEQGTGTPSVTFEYFPKAPDYAYAVAHHFDAFHPGDTIDTVAFLDGIGRETQTKQDGTVFRGGDTGAEDVMIVGGAVEFDALGRPVKEWYPIEEPLGTIGVYNTGTSATDPTETSWTLTDLETRVVSPDGSTTETAYGFGGEADLGATVFTTTVTDAEGKPQRSYSDVRDSVLIVDDLPAGAPRMRTRYTYDPLGQLTRVVDSAGNLTTHTYDLLGRRTSTRTPDGGLVELRWDGAGNLVAKVTPNLRALGQQIDYAYDADRLVAVDYPAGTEDVAYTYGEAGDPDNGAGRIVAVEDGAQVQRLAYDRLGAVAEETTTMLVHNLNEETEERLTFVTSLTYDGLGRTRTLTYPDGEVLAHDYDSGGLLASISGEKAGHVYDYLDRLEYDEFLDRRFQETGTGVRTVYGYDADTRRLARQTTDTPDREIQDLNYTYDLVGNVMELDNRLPDPVPELKGGPSTQTYHYDPYYRLTSAEGTYFFAPDKRRDYTVRTAFDVNGNVVSKNQTDIVTVPGGSQIEQNPTHYNLRTIEYRGAGPHQISRIARRPYTYDLNGNFTGWTDDKTGQRRTVTWDAADRMRSVADQGSTTRYTYDHSGRLAIERGPSGETSFVNRWYTVRNGTVAWKHVWAGDDRLASKRAFDDGSYEHMRYFLHKDLQGSTNVVTDDGGLVFQHLEYFPSGETWVQEHNDIHRTPYLYTGGYFDEVRKLIDLGERWYEPREQFLYSPDPVLVEDPLRVVDDPALLPAYSYAESNPLRLVDLDGRSPSTVRAAFSMASALLRGRQDPATARFAVRTAEAVVAAARATGMTQADLAARVAAVQAGDTGSSSRLWQALERFAGSPKAKKLAAFTDRFEAKPLLSVNLVKTGKGWAVQDVKVSPTFFLKQFTVFKGATGQPPGAAGAGAPAAPAPGAGAAAPAPVAALGAGPALPAPQGASQRAAPPPDSEAP